MPPPTHRAVILSPLPLYCQGLARQLADSPLDVVGTASSVEAAEQLVRDTRPEFVLLDASASGFPAIVRSLRATPGVRVVAFAVGPDDADVISCAELGVAAYVSKDALIDDLVETVLRCARGELHVAPHLASALFRRVGDLTARQATTTAPASPARMASLTPRERDILALVRDGLSNKEIAARLRLRLPTVKNHVHHILEKLGVRRRAQAVARAAHESLEPDPR